MFQPFSEMSILDYYSRKTGTLPNPSGVLSSSIPPRAIDLANREVNELVQSPQNSQRPKRETWQVALETIMLVVFAKHYVTGTAIAISEY